MNLMNVRYTGQHMPHASWLLPPQTLDNSEVHRVGAIVASTHRKIIES